MNLSFWLIGKLPLITYHAGSGAETHGNPSSCVSLYVEVEVIWVSLVSLNSHVHFTVTEITVER